MGLVGRVRQFAACPLCQSPEEVVTPCWPRVVNPIDNFGQVPAAWVGPQDLWPA